MEEMKMEPKGGNSPIRYFIYLGEEKIAMAKRGNKRRFTKDFWIVDVYNPIHTELISDYLHDTKRIERFYWGYIAEKN